MEKCPECGAEWPEGQTCQAIFDEFLVWEFQDPEYGAVHFLTVAVFMTQHGRYTDEAQAWIQGKLRASLDEGQSTEQIRRTAYHETNQAKRTWKVVREASDPPAKRLAWDMTIVDVAREHEQSGYEPARYREAVMDWARKTLRQLDKNSNS